jgi:hypothetical protein
MIFIIVLNVCVPTQDKTDDLKGWLSHGTRACIGSVTEAKHRILLGAVNENVGTVYISMPTMGINNSHAISNDNGASVIQLPQQKMFPHHSVHKYSWTSAG